MNLMTIDTETTNSLDDPIVYDLVWQFMMKMVMYSILKAL